MKTYRVNAITLLAAFAALAAAGVPAFTGCSSGAPIGDAPARQTHQTTGDLRSAVLAAARPAVGRELSDVETATGLRVRFRPLPDDSHVIAQYGFDPNANTATVFLRAGWEDVDVAHELMHMKLELVEGYAVLAWRRGVERSVDIEAAFGRVRSYVDDQVVHARLARAGYRLDGEVLRPQLFDDMYTKVPRYLEEGRARPDDGMAHLDRAGYGDLCRSAFLVQAELVLEGFADDLPPRRRDQARRFVRAFRAHRAREAARADGVLALFRKHDVHTVAGHRAILGEWSRMEGLDRFVGLSSYRRRDGRYILPWPGDAPGPSAR